MKKLLHLAVLCMFFSAQAQTTWEKKLILYYNGKLSAGEPTGMVETPDKGFIISGKGLPLSENIWTGFVYKINASGDSVWSKTYTATGFRRIANVFYNNNGKLMIAMETLIPNKKHNIVFAELNENTGDTSNSFLVPKPNNADGYQYTKHIELADGSYVVLARDISTGYENASHMFRFMPGSTTQMWAADSLAKRVGTYFDMIYDNDGVILSGSINTGHDRTSYTISKYGLEGTSRWHKTFAVASDYRRTNARSLVATGDGKYITVGDKFETVDGVHSATSATAVVSQNGDSVYYTSVEPYQGGTLNSVIKMGGGYYAVGKAFRTVKDANGQNRTITFMTLYAINASGKATKAQDFDFGLTVKNGFYQGTVADGRDLLASTDGELVVYGVGTFVMPDSSTLQGPYIVKMKAPTVSVNEKQRVHNSLKLFPNPCTDNLFINTSGNSGKLIIYNMLGQEVYSDILIGTGNKNVDVKHFSQGTYMVQLVNSHGVSTAKFIKN